MEAILIILLILFLTSFVINIFFIREANNISSQLDFLAQNKSQMRLTVDFNVRSFKELSDKINSFLDSFHKKESSYILKEKYLQDTITGLSHDIRTPLTSLDGYLQLLSKSENVKDKEKYLVIIKNRVKSLNNILDQLFTFVKLQEEEYTFDMEKVDIRKTALETLFNYYEDFKFRSIEPEIDFTENESYIISNKDALQRIFQNIYKNILEHGTNPFSLYLKESEDEIIFISKNKIKDDINISKDKIFEEFYKASKSRSGSSTGLGLSITKSLVEKLDGNISAKVSKNTFIIQITFKKN